MVSIEANIEVDNTEEIKEALGDAIEKALVEIGILVEGYAVPLCPVDTGRLSGSITYATTTERDSVREPARDGDEVPGEPDEDSVIIGTNVEYAAYVELGTSRMSPRPYLTPAVNDHLDEYHSIVEEILHNS